MILVVLELPLQALDVRLLEDSAKGLAVLRVAIHEQVMRIFQNTVEGGETEAQRPVRSGLVLCAHGQKGAIRVVPR